MARTPGLLILASLFLLGCEEREPQSNWPKGSVTELVTLGSIDDPVLGFASVDGLAAGSYLYVLQRSVGEVTVLTREGELVHRLGGKGQGPGEFLVPSGLGLRADTLWVLDNGNRRISYFVEDELIREESYPDLSLDRGENAAAVLPLAQGAALVVVARDFESPPGDPDNSFPLLHVKGGEAVQIAALRESYPFRVRIGTSSVSPPVNDFPLFEVAPSGDFVVIVDRPVPDGPEARIRVSKISVGGDTLVSRMLTRPAVPYTDADWDRRLDQLFSALEPSFSRSDYQAAAHRPEWQVPVSGLQVGLDGAIWIGFENLPGADSVVWLALTELGEPRVEISLPASFRLQAAMSDELWGVVRDEFDIPYVRGYRVRSAR